MLCYIFICFTPLFFMFSFITGKSKRGELSIFPKSFTVLSHCLHMMPRQKVAPGSDNAKVSNIFFPFPLLCLITWGFPFSYATNILQKAEVWVPGNGRNPETYILKDQVLIAATSFSLSSEPLYCQY